MALARLLSAPEPARLPRMVHTVGAASRPALRSIRRKFGRAAGPVTLVAAALCLAGCYRYTEVRDLDARARDGTIEWARVTTPDQAEFALRDVTLLADSIVGKDAGARRALARGDVIRLRERKPDVAQMAIASAGLAAIGYFVLARPGHD